MTAWEVKFSEAMSSMPFHCRAFSFWIRENISGSTSARGVFPHDENVTRGHGWRASCGFAERKKGDCSESEPTREVARIGVRGRAEAGMEVGSGLRWR